MCLLDKLLGRRAVRKCKLCCKVEAMPFICPYCGGTFCREHNIPEQHRCDHRVKRPLTNFERYIEKRDSQRSDPRLALSQNEKKLRFYSLPGATEYTYYGSGGYQPKPEAGGIVAWFKRLFF